MSQGTRAVRGPHFSAVVFDLFGTLTSWTNEAQRQRLGDELADLLGADRDEFRREMRDSFSLRATGDTGDTRSTLTYLAGRLGLSPSAAALDEAVERRLAHERFIVAPTPEALSALGEARKRECRVGILSDCGPEIVEVWATLPYAPHVDAAVFSYDVGARKPDPRMYTAITNALHVTAAECLYIGDGASTELSGARTAGMTAVMLDACTDADLQYDREQAWTGRRISTLAEITDLLEHH